MNEFIPGETPVPYAGRVYDQHEIDAGVKSVRDFWLTLGPEGAAFEKEFAEYLGVKYTTLTNSGSSANLLALSALTSQKIGTTRIKRGDEVITAAAGFPTTVAPIVQCGLVPVFIDSDPATLNIRPEEMMRALTKNTRAVMIAHTLGNPFDVVAVRQFCNRYGLWLIEDNCDSAGSTVSGIMTGTFGDLSTQSFYPAHHITMGEGGAVNTSSPLLQELVESFRDWGRDCWCDSGKDNTCHKRFGWSLGEMAEGYDHKYTYAHLGYNLKPTDIQAAIGRVQFRKLPGFVQARKDNWLHLCDGLSDLKHCFDFQYSASDASASWFGFLLMVKPGAPFTRNQLAQKLTAAKIGNRMLFGGNLVRQPAFVNLRNDNPDAFRVVGNLEGADRIMNDALFVGVYPGLTTPMIDYMIKTIHEIANT